MLNKYAYSCGKIKLCKYLRGSKTVKRGASRAREEKYYGICIDMTEKDVLKIIDFLISKGVFKETSGLYPILKIVSDIENIDFNELMEIVNID